MLVFAQTLYNTCSNTSYIDNCNISCLLVLHGIDNAACSSTYIIYDANNGKRLKTNTNDVRTIISITDNTKWCHVTNCSTCTNNTEVLLVSLVLLPMWAYMGRIVVMLQ